MGASECAFNSVISLLVAKGDSLEEGWRASSMAMRARIREAVELCLDCPTVEVVNGDLLWFHGARSELHSHVASRGSPRPRPISRLYQVRHFRFLLSSGH